MDEQDMLIDFNSPARKSELSTPLIPVPPQVPILLSSEDVEESVVDPFEVQIPDPFDVAIRAATVKPQVSEDYKTENILITIQSDDSANGDTPNIECPQIKVDLVSSSSSDNVNITPKSNQASSRNEIPKDCKGSPSEKNIINDCEEILKNSHSTPVVKNIIKDALKNSSKYSSKKEDDNQSQILSDFSTEESLKAIIAKRVNRCIQETLNGSINRNNSLLKRTQNKRSLSFIGLPSASVKKECDRLNKSCTDVNDSFDLENQQLDNSSDSSGFGVLSRNSNDVSIEEENGEDKVFKEARKLSRTFSKLAESFRRAQESDSDDEDLMKCKPRWLSTDSSEDEEEKLLKDPALNFRRRSDGSTSSTPAAAPPSAKGLDSPALLAYKSRRSFTQLQALNNTQEELTLKRSISVGSHLKEVPVPVIPTIVATGPVNLLKTDDQPLKLRKKNFGDMKKGPLRAVMPVQSMTKEPLQAPAKKSPKQDTSPESRIQKSVFVIRTPSKDGSQLNLVPPMASSTPNKEESFVSSKANASLLLKPATVVNKRHSLEGSFGGGGHKSREATADGGAKPRSSSVNSSIPRVMQVKPLRGLPLAPKSTSNLQAPRTQINVNNVPVKKNTSHLKNDVKKRVLADVKTKSPIQAKVRTAVNTISSLVRGKKSAARDKENRIPV